MTDVESLSSFDEGSEFVGLDFSDVFFERLLSKALKEHSTTKKYSNECKSAIVDTVGEFMPCFIILGYDFNGEAIEIVKGKTDQEKESLGMRLQKFAPSYFSKQFKSGEDDF
jgi:hypothetical protein